MKLPASESGGYTIVGGLSAEAELPSFRDSVVIDYIGRGWIQRSHRFSSNCVAVFSGLKRQV